MKKKVNNTFLHKTLGISLCFMALSCLCVTNVYAQDEVEEEDVVVKKITKEKKEKTYEMKEVKGFVTDDATGAPMGGVRIQALGLERYSTLTEEDGSYKLSIPVFSDAVYVYAEESEAEADFKEHADADAAKKAEELGDNRPDQLQYLEVLLNDTPVRYRASDDGSIYMRFNAGIYVYVADTRDVDGTTWYSDGTYWIKGDSHVLLRTAEK